MIAQIEGGYFESAVSLNVIVLVATRIVVLELPIQPKWKLFLNNIGTQLHLFISHAM